MISCVGETVSRTTTIVPSWNATLVWDVDNLAFEFLESAVTSGVSTIKQEALGKSLSWSISLSEVSAYKFDWLLYLSGDNVEEIKYCTYEVFVERAGIWGQKRFTGDGYVTSMLFQNFLIQYHIEKSKNIFGYTRYLCYRCYSLPLDTLIYNCNDGPPQGAIRFSVKLMIVFWEENRPGLIDLKVAKHFTAPEDSRLAGLFNNELYSDATIECGEKSFFVHKQVLGQSPVLAKAFSTPMKESNSNKYTISDLDPTTLELFLKSLCGVPYELPPVIEELLELINCAEKYLVMSIKAACFHKLAGMLSDENAAVLNIAAHKFCVNDEMKEFRDVFRNYYQERHIILLKNPGYRQLVKENFDAFM